MTKQELHRKKSINLITRIIRDNYLPLMWTNLSEREKFSYLELLGKAFLGVRQIGTCQAVEGEVSWSEKLDGYKISLNYDIGIQKQLNYLAREIGHIILHLDLRAGRTSKYPKKLAATTRSLAQEYSLDEEKENIYFAKRMLLHTCYRAI